jgi:hypothetical protein
VVNQMTVQGANIKADFVALLTCDETAHMLLAREEKGWALLMATSAAMLLTLTDPQSLRRSSNAKKDETKKDYGLGMCQAKPPAIIHLRHRSFSLFLTLRRHQERLNMR